MTHDDLTPDEMADAGPPLSPEALAAAATYHAPPPLPPRDQMWAAIQARRGTATMVTSTPAVVTPTLTVERTTRRQMPAWLPRGLAAAAALAVVVTGVRLARSASSTGPTTTIAVRTDSAATGMAWQVASTEHLGDAESMLTTFATSRDAQNDRQLTEWSRDLLASTRLLMDSPAGRDPKRRALLLDLELVLVQLVESGPATNVDDRNVMDELLSRSALLLTRIRTTIPAGLPARTY